MYDDPRAYSGSTVEAEFGNYWREFIDPEAYVFFHLADQTRLAVPRALLGRARGLIRDVLTYGPDRAGYVRVGDTLVPAHLSPGNRRLLARAGAQ